MDTGGNYPWFSIEKILVAFVGFCVFLITIIISNIGEENAAYKCKEKMDVFYIESRK